MKTKVRLKNVLASLEELLSGDLDPHLRVPIRNAAVLIRLALSLITRHAEEKAGHD